MHTILVNMYIIIGNQFHLHGYYYSYSQKFLINQLLILILRYPISVFLTFLWPLTSLITAS